MRTKTAPLSPRAEVFWALHEQWENEEKIERMKNTRTGAHEARELSVRRAQLRGAIGRAFGKDSQEPGMKTDN